MSKPQHRDFRILLRRLPQILLLVLATVLIARTDNYFSTRNLSSIVNLASIVGVLAVGQSFAILGGGFDLAQGATLALTAATAARLMSAHAWHPTAALVAALGCGALVGVLHGVSVGYARTSAFVATLSSSLILRGLTFLLLDGRQIPTEAYMRLADPIWPGGPRITGLAIVFLATVGVAWVGLRYTVFGQHLYAVGGNAHAARLAGVRTRWVVLLSFAISGLAAAVAGILWLAFTGVSKPDSAQGYELKSIAACVIGGISLSGGQGSVLGAAAGCLLLQALTNLIGLAGLRDEFSTLVTGSVILIFALTDALARASERR